MSACPPRKTLLSYEHGELPDGEVGELERHLGGCESCRTLLEQLRATDPDTHLMRRVFHFTHASESAGESESDLSTRTPMATAPETGSLPGAEQLPVAPDYERIALCGEGSFGSVWAVRDRAGVHRAMKIIEVDRLAAGRRGVRRAGRAESLLPEGRAASAPHHRAAHRAQRRLPVLHHGAGG